PDPHRVVLRFVEPEQREPARELPEREQGEDQRGLASRRGRDPEPVPARRPHEHTKEREEQRQNRGLTPTEHHGVARAPGSRGGYVLPVSRAPGATVEHPAPMSH